MREKILKLFEAINQMNIADQWISQIMNALVVGFEQGNEAVMTQEQKEIFARVETMLRNSARDMQDEIVSVYERFYTEEDVDGLITFFMSPLGKRMVERQGKVLEASGEVGQRWAAEQMEKLRDIESLP